jgi:hypothetical protein
VHRVDEEQPDHRSNKRTGNSMDEAGHRKSGSPLMRSATQGPVFRRVPEMFMTLIRAWIVGGKLCQRGSAAGAARLRSQSPRSA